MSILKKILAVLSFLIIILSHDSHGQCNVNASVCSSGTTAPFSFVSQGPAVSTCLDFLGPNYGYIMMYITQGGSLNLLIDGNATSGFLDVAVFNIPAGAVPCTAIQNTANQISCNYASSSSGCNQFGTAFPCASAVPAPMVSAGQTLMIVVENWSGSSSNFTLQLATTPGSAQGGSPNAAINPTGPICINAAPVQLSAVNSGGIWSGPGTSSTGLFNPTVAGFGTHTINYSIGVAPCISTSSTTITVTPGTVGIATPASQSLCSGSATSIALSGSATGTTFSWTVAQNGVTGASAGSGTSIAQILTNNNSSPGAAIYTITPMANGCPGAVIKDTVTVKPLPVATATPTAQTICSGEATSIALSSSLPGATYDWTVVQNGITGAVAGSGSSIAQTLTTTGSIAGTVVYSIIPIVNGCPGVAVKDTITVNPLITPEFAPIPPICNGDIAPSLPGTSTNGITGTWNPAVVSNSATGTYTFTPSAGQCTIPITITVTVNPIPVVTVTPTVSICSGSATNLAPTSSVAGSSFSWTVAQTGVTGATAGNGTSIAQTLTVPGSTAGTASYTITPSANGCSGIAATSIVTVKPLPVATATPTTQTICSATATNVTLTSSLTGTTFAWNITQNGVTGGAAGSGTSIAQTLTNAGAAPASATYSIVPTANGCPGTDMLVTITVNPKPVVTITPSSQTLCSGDITAISLTSVTPGTTYSWTVNQIGVTGGIAGSGNAIAQTLSIITSTTGTATYTVTPTANTCIGNTNTATVTVNTTPATPGTIIGADAPCVGSTQIYSVASVPGASSYIWTLPPGWSGTSATNTITVIPGSNNGTITIKSSNACGTSNENSKTVTATPILTPAVSISHDAPALLCSGTMVTFTANTTAAGSQPLYQWMLNGAAMGTNNDTFIYAPADGDTIVCILTSNYPCLTNNNVSSNMIIMNVTETVSPSLNIYVEENHVCSDETVTFLATPQHGGSAPSYQWQRNNLNVGTGGINYSYIPVDGDVITCVMNSNAVCAIPSSVLSNAVPMSVIQVTHPAISISANPGANVSNGQTVTFTANVTGEGPSGYQVRWYRNNVFMPQVTGLNWNAVAGTDIFHNAAIKAELTSFSSCAIPEDTFSNVLKMSVGALSLTDRNVPENFVVYPNPTTDMILFDGLHRGDMLVLRDVTGRDIQTRKIDKEGTYKMDISNLAQGVYFFSFEDGDNRWQVKVFKN